MCGPPSWLKPPSFETEAGDLAPAGYHSFGFMARIGLIGDSHDDWVRLEAGLALLQRLECDSIVCLGDIVGSKVPNALHYWDVRDSHRCVQLVQEHCDLVVAGNHDLYAVEKTPKYSSNYKYPRNFYRQDYFSRREAFKERIWHYEDELPTLLDRNDRLYLISLNEVELKHHEELLVMYSHYAYPDFSGSTTRIHQQTRYLDQHFRYMAIHQCRLSFSGHYHPEGLVIATPDGWEQEGFDARVTLNPDQKYWCCVPALFSSADRPSAVTVFDTQTLQLEVHAL